MLRFSSTKAMRHALSFGTAILATLLLVSYQARAEDNWQIQTLWEGGSINQKVVERFADNVEQMSDGRLTIEVLPVGAIVAHNETLEAVGSGILTGQQSATTYFTGRDPAFGLLGDLNGGYEDPYQQTLWFYQRGGLELARELYAEHNIHYVGPVFWGVESLPMKERVEGIADLEGVKLRMPEGSSSDLFRLAGASPTNIPGSEVYTSLERGVIDGTDWGTLSMNQDLGYHEIAPYPIYPGFHSMPVGDFAVNMDAWNELDDDLKAIVETAVRELNYDMIRTIKAADLKAKEEAVAQGAELVSWSEDERHNLRELAAEVWAEYGEKNDMTRRIYESQMAFLNELGLISE